MKVNRKNLSTYVANNVAKAVRSPYVFEFAPVVA